MPAGRTRTPAKSSRFRPDLEALDDRSLLSATLGANGVLTILGDPAVAGDQITVNRGAQIWVDEYGNNIFTWALNVNVNGQSYQFDIGPDALPGADLVTAIDIRAGVGNDTVAIWNRGGLGVPVTIDGGEGQDTITLTNRSQPNPDPANYFPDGAGCWGGVVTVTGDGADTLATYGVAAALSVTNSTVEYSTLHADMFAGPATVSVSYSGLTGITVDAFGASAVTRVRSTAASTPVTINDQDGSVEIGSSTNQLTGILGAVTVNGGTGSVAVTVTDTGTATAQTFTVGDRTVSRTGTATITYANVDTLRLRTGTHNDTVDISGTRTGTPTTIETGNGDDRINVGATANNLNALLGALTANGGAGYNYLTVLDQTASGNKTYVVNTSAMSRSGAENIYFQDIDSWVLNGGTGNDTILVVAAPTAGYASVNGGTGADTLVGPNAANTWYISSRNGGAVGELRFAAVENLRGNSQADLYSVWSGGELTGTVDGMGGTDTLDYGWLNFMRWGVPLNVQVDLGTGSATAIRGGLASSVFGIENAAGSSGNDTLTGNGGNNILSGYSGNDTISGAGGRDLVIAGAGADTIDGGSGEDILVGGTTAYDGDYTALGAIMGEWVRLVSQTTRMNNIRAGVGPNMMYWLDNSTVLPDTDADTVLNPSTTDWDWGG